MRLQHLRGIFIWTLLLAVGGCSDTSVREIKALIDHSDIKQEPLSETGNNPYTVYGVTYVPLPSAVGYREKGVASWYGEKFHGKRTSSGETYDMYAMTAAHKTLPLPSYVAVTNLRNGRKVIVKVNDRGPFIDDRIIDLSYSAARELRLIGPGTGPVLVESLTPWDTTGVAVKPAAPKYFVSTGVFRNQNYADNLTDQLNGSGFSKARVRSKSVSGAQMYQVLVGPYDSEPEARNIMSQLTQILSEEPALVLE